MEHQYGFTSTMHPPSSLSWISRRQDRSRCPALPCIGCLGCPCRSALCCAGFKHGSGVNLARKCELEPGIPLECQWPAICLTCDGSEGYRASVQAKLTRFLHVMKSWQLLLVAFFQVPVQSWFDDMTDTELLDLIPFFEGLSKEEEVYSMLHKLCNR